MKLHWQEVILCTVQQYSNHNYKYSVHHRKPRPSVLLYCIMTDVIYALPGLDTLVMESRKYWNSRLEKIKQMVLDRRVRHYNVNVILCLQHSTDVRRIFYYQ